MFETPTINIDDEMLAIISEIDKFSASWQYMGEMEPEKLKGLKKVSTIESVGSSNRIEGNKLSDKEVEELLSKINKQSFKDRDEEEVAGYAKLSDTIFDNWSLIPISENYIKQMHKILLEFSTKDERHKGEYKKTSNAVVAYDNEGKEIGVVFETATPFETPIKMAEIVQWLDKNLNDGFYHPLIVIGVFVVNFLAIHPFQDGNGRLSRALTSFLLLKAGYSYIPYSSNEAVIEDNKEGYYRALRETQATFNEKPDYDPWLKFFLRTLQKQKIRLEYKLKTFEAPPLHLELPPISAKIMEYINLKQRAELADLLEFTGANVNTLKKHIANLVKENYLIKHGKTKGAWYTKA